MLNRQKLQSFIDSYKDKFIKELDETCKDLLDTNDTNLIDLDEEYDIPQCDNVIHEPIIYIQSNSYRLEGMEQRYNFYQNFPLDILLNQNENIIKIFMIENSSDLIKNAKYTFELKHFKNISTEVIYITNYGRLFKVGNKYEYMGNDATVNYIFTNYDNKYNNLKEIKYNVEIDHNRIQKIILKSYITTPLKLIPQPELNYKIPKIFIDVIDAFHTQNTDLMQSCCKKYLDILNKTKNVEKIIEKYKIIKNQQEQLLEKDKEIERLKLEMEELKKFYINS